MEQDNFLNFYKDYVEARIEKGISIEVSNTCPLKCPYCTKNIPEEIEKLKSIKNITHENFTKLVEFSTTVRLIGTYTDPIYHSDFLSLLDFSQKYKSKQFSIRTNGTRKSVDWWKEAFKRSGKNVSWVFGLDGTDQETANIYRVNTRFDEVMEVMKLGVSMGVDVTWQFIVFEHNEHQVELAKKIASDIGVILEVVLSGRWETPLMDIHKIYPPVNPLWNKITDGNKNEKYIYFKPYKRK